MPHQPTIQQTWEEPLLDLIKATNESYGGRLSDTLLRLVESVSNLSRAFFLFETRYDIASVTPRDSVVTLETAVNTLKVTVQWPDIEDLDLTVCGANNLAKLEILRTAFAPVY